MSQTKMELLAPAGDVKAAIGALNAGADAVYLGAPAFSARAFAKNLTTDEIIYVLHYAHLNNAKVYLALNTLLKNKEIPEALRIVAPLYREGLDGIIVQDLGFLVLLARAFPKLALHASTQLAILSSQGIEFLRQLSISRVVPGRELSVDEIKSLKQCGLELECFIHGAMCYCYSGRCLMSSLAGGRSGNRGRCAGPCRKKYEIVYPDSLKGINGYLLSMKDMCALPVLEELAAAGVDSYKIEGRMKDPAYAAGVCEIYRKYFAQLNAGSSHLNIHKQDLKQLASLYIRSEIQEGYYHKHNGRDMITLASPSYKSMEETTRNRIYAQYVDSTRKKHVSMEISVFTGCPLSLRLVCDEKEIFVEGEIAEKARKHALTEDDIKKQLCRLGDSFFLARSIEVYTDQESFVPVKSLNSLRRKAIDKLHETLLPRRNDDKAEEVISGIAHKLTVHLPEKRKPLTLPDIKIQVESEKQLQICYSKGCRSFLLPAHLLTPGDALWKHLTEYEGCRFYYQMPSVVREKHRINVQRELMEIEQSGRFSGVYCSSLDALSMAEEHFTKDNIFLDNGIYVLNEQTEAFVLQHAAIYTASYELNEKELQHFTEKSRREMILYGRQEIMQSAGCVYKTAGSCSREHGYLLLKDEDGREFPVLPRHKYCYNTILNCEPLSLHAFLMSAAAASENAGYRINFTTESPAQIQEVLAFYQKILNGCRDAKPGFNYTTGHMKRGVD